MISDLLQNVLLFLATAFNMILAPIDNFLAQNLPGIASALNSITDFFSQLGSVSQWVVSYFGLTNETLSIIVLGFIAPTTISLLIFPIKLGIKWFRSLKIG